MLTDADRSEPPVELRFIDLFLLVQAALLLTILLLLTLRPGADVPPTILTRGLPAAMLREPYRVALSARHGTAPLSWRVAEGALPEGLGLRDGIVAGTPREPGTRRVVFAVSDARERWERAAVDLVVRGRILPGERPRSLSVEADVTILPDAVGGREYSQQLVAVGGARPHAWSLAGGWLPPNLSLSAAGVVAGRPEGTRPSVLWSLFQEGAARQQRLREMNTNRFEVAVTDSGGQRRTQAVILFTEPRPRSFVWAVVLGEFSGTVRWPWVVLSLVIRGAIYLALLGLVSVPLFPVFRYLFGYDLTKLDGWRGLRERPTGESGSGALGPLVGAFAFVIDRLLAFLRAAWVILLAVPVAVVSTLLLATLLPDLVLVTLLVAVVLVRLAINIVRVRRAGPRAGESMRSTGADPGDAAGGLTEPPSPRPSRRLSWFDWLVRAGLALAAAASIVVAVILLPWFASVYVLVAVCVACTFVLALLSCGREVEMERRRMSPPPPPEPEPWPFGGGDGGGSGGGGGRGGGGGEGGDGSRESEYLKGLRKGGTVKYGGAFLGLPFVRRAGLDRVVEESFRPLPEIGKGLLHTSLDGYFRHLLGVSSGPTQFRQLDDRFDVVLGRRGPAPPRKGDRREPNAQGSMVLPTGLAPPMNSNPSAAEEPPEEEPAPREAPDQQEQAEPQDPGLSEQEQQLLAVCGVGPDRERWRHVHEEGAGEQLEAAMGGVAAGARRWLARLPVDRGGRPIPESRIRRILRSRAFVQLKGDTLRVRLTGRLRSGDRRAAEELCRALNTHQARTLGPHNLPIEFGI